MKRAKKSGTAQAVGRSGRTDCSAFLDGLLYAAQFMAISHREDLFAQDILYSSGFSRRDLLMAQRRSGYESRIMCRVIRLATPNPKVDGGGTL